MQNRWRYLRRSGKNPNFSAKHGAAGQIELRRWGGAMTPAETIARALGEACRSGGWWRCRCPVHQSSGATLALRDGPRGLIAHCHAGCRGMTCSPSCAGSGCSRMTAQAGPPDPAEMERRREAEERNRQKRIAEALDFWRHESCRSIRARCRALLALARSGDCRSRQRSAPRGPGCAIPKAASGRRWSRWSSMSSTARSPSIGHGCGRRRGKATFREPRLSLGPVGGGAVRLAAAREEAADRRRGHRDRRERHARDGLARLGGAQRRRHRAADPAAAAARRNRRHRRRSTTQTASAKEPRGTPPNAGSPRGGGCGSRCRRSRHRLERRAAQQRHQGGAPCRVMEPSACAPA